MIDLAAHAAASRGLTRPETSAELFVALAEAGALPGEQASAARQWVDFRNIREFTAPEWLRQFGEIWAGFLREGEYRGIYPILLPDGSYRELLFNARANCAPGRHFTFVNESPSHEPSLSDQPYLTLCAWTKRVRLGEEWVPIEEYLRHTSGLQVSHGISPDAIAELAQEA